MEVEALEVDCKRSTLRAVAIAVTSMIPGAGSIVTGADQVVQALEAQWRAERLNTLLDALDEGKLSHVEAITEPLVRAARITVEATIKQHRREKIRAFARLLIAGTETPPRLNLDLEHEDYLNVLDELSIRELGVLHTLSEFEHEYPLREGENDLQRVGHYWDEFKRVACERHSIPPDEFSGLLIRIMRTGMFELIIGSYIGYQGGRGKLTGAYRRLASLIEEGATGFNPQAW